MGREGPLGGNAVTRDDFGNPTGVQETYRDGTLGDYENRTYSGQDPRPLTAATTDLTLHYVYSGSTLNVKRLYASQSDWGYQITAGFTPRDEHATTVVRAGASLSSSYELNHLTHASQGTGGVQLLYGLGGLTYAVAGGSCYYETRLNSFAASGAKRDVNYGATGGVRTVYSKYGRPVSVQRLTGSSSPTPLASLTYAFTDEAGETETYSSPLRRIDDSVTNSTTVFTLSSDGLTRTATRTCPSNPSTAISASVTMDDMGRVAHRTVISATRSHAQSVAVTYLGGTNVPTQVGGTLQVSGVTYTFSQSTPLDAKGRTQYVASSLGSFEVTSTPSYSLDRVTSISTTVMPTSHVPSTSTEGLTLDSAGRVTARTIGDGGNKSESFVRDGNGRIIRENNERLGASYFYDYDSSGNLWRVRQGPYSTSGSSTSTLHTFGFTSAWGALLTSVDGVSVASVSGYPSSIAGTALTWQSGRLASYGANSFSYDAFGNLVGRAGSGRDSTFVRDPSGRLIEEISDSYSVLFLYGARGPMGFVVRGGSAAGNYLYRFDAYGNVSAIVNGSGVVARYAYDAFGNGKVYDASWNENASQSFVGNVNPIRYKGGLYDKESGLYLFGTRWYAPFLYRWLSPDGVDYLDASRIDGVNPYVYCYNDPVTYTDATGHEAIAFTFGTIMWILAAAGLFTLAVTEPQTHLLTNLSKMVAEGIGDAFDALGDWASTWDFSWFGMASNRAVPHRLVIIPIRFWVSGQT
ncbi:MAG: RHS repeat-associated core domain-containing protein [Erysipelotrichaceae bacterium]|nr:RHS repeat-associated core domain-containing protein [Erysipelotrichaceae bacterium]